MADARGRVGALTSCHDVISLPGDGTAATYVGCQFFTDFSSVVRDLTFLAQLKPDLTHKM